jgi:hypothetical protein
MDSVFAMLKQAREAKSLTLTDIADATFINIRYLEAIEEGKTDILPQAYVRAFIREYATIVGLDAAEVMRRLDSARAPQPVPAAQPAPDRTTVPPTSGPTPPDETNQPPPVAPPAEEQKKESKPQTSESHFTAPTEPQEQEPPAPRRDLTDLIQKAAVAMAVIVIAVVLWNVMGIEKPKTHEIPFQSVVKENELHASGPAKKDSSRTPAVQGSRVDSLTLLAQTTDSVWVQVIVDGGLPREYLFKPNARASWKAAQKFLLTIGNAGAVQLWLNRKDLGVLGKRGAVIQKLELTRASLSR